MKNYRYAFASALVVTVVTLAGVVQSRPEADRVVEMTKTIQGVKEIRNGLEVRP